MRAGIFSLLFMLLFSSVIAQPQSGSFQRKYFEPLTKTESQSISYLVNSLANKSMVTLLFQKDSMDKAGDQVETVHPLRFWKEILTNPQLRSQLPKMRGIPKRRFIQGFEGSFALMKKMGQMNPEYVEDFSKATGIPKQQIEEYIQSNQWNQLLQLFFNSAKQS